MPPCNAPAATRARPPGFSASRATLCAIACPKWAYPTNRSHDLDQPVIISAKTLGQLAMPGYCPRCFWLAMKADRLPFQIFPGIFSAIDSYGKSVVHGWFDRYGRPPSWLEPLGLIR